MDIICIDANLNLDKKPDRPTQDPLGRLWNVKHWFKPENIEKIKTQDINLSVNLKTRIDNKDLLKFIKNSLTNENAYIVCNPLQDEMKQDLVFNDGGFVDVFSLPTGRHYFRCYKNDIEYMGQDVKRKAKCHWCSNETNSEVNLPWFEERGNEETDLYDCGCRGFN